MATLDPAIANYFNINLTEPNSNTLALDPWNNYSTFEEAVIETLNLLYSDPKIAAQIDISLLPEEPLTIEYIEGVVGLYIPETNTIQFGTNTYLLTQTDNRFLGQDGNKHTFDLKRTLLHEIIHARLKLLEGGVYNEQITIAITNFLLGDVERLHHRPSPSLTLDPDATTVLPILLDGFDLNSVDVASSSYWQLGFSNSNGDTVYKTAHYEVADPSAPATYTEILYKSGNGAISSQNIEKLVDASGHPRKEEAKNYIQELLSTDGPEITTMLFHTGEQFQLKTVGPSHNDRKLQILATTGNIVLGSSGFNGDTNSTDDLVGNSHGTDILIAGDGNGNKLRGYDGDDYLFGGNKVDEIFGGDGQDTIYGGKGNDRLYAGVDAETDDGRQDELSGGSGDDTFYVGNKDIIIDPDKGDRVYWNGENVSRGVRQIECASNEIFRSGNYIYQETFGSLKITNYTNGHAITLRNWSDGDAGITLVPSDDDPCDDDDRPPIDRLASPLVLDLDGDGMESTSLESSGTFYDIDNDGFAERTGWISSDDGFLVLDENQDGIINNQSEMFGSGFTTDITSLENIYTESGFADLARLNTNFNSIFDAGDDRWSEVQVWRDFDQDGKSDDGELFSLDELGIISIDLNATDQNVWQNGNFIPETSTFTWADNSTSEIADIWFNYNPKDTVELNTPETIDDVEINALPTLVGYGEVSDLDVAMSRDPLLAEMIEDIVNNGTTDLSGLLSKTERA